jgi:chemotaxis protein methyltransferase CheR
MTLLRPHPAPLTASELSRLPAPAPSGVPSGVPSPPATRPSPQLADAAIERHLEVIGSYVESRSAILCPPAKRYLFEARLRPVLREHGLADLAELAGRLRQQPHGRIGDDVVEAMTTNETSWFRDIHPFEALRSTVVPELLERRRAGRQLNVWSAASSTGQELFSLAMMLDSGFPELEGWNVQYLGTDISAAVVAQANSARYSALEVNRGLPAQHLARYMVRDGAHYVVADRLRARTTFTTMNLVGTWPLMPRFDLVLCRNVLIYFDMDVRARIIRRIRDALAPGGYLLLGSSETSLGVMDGFTRTVVGRTTLYRKDTL